MVSISLPFLETGRDKLAELVRRIFRRPRSPASWDGGVWDGDVWDGGDRAKARAG